VVLQIVYSASCTFGWQKIAYIWWPRLTHFITGGEVSSRSQH